MLIGTMSSKPIAVACVLYFIAILAFSDTSNLMTREGRTYSNVVVRRVEPNGITFQHSTGLAKLHYNELPEEWQKKFKHDPMADRAYSQKQVEAQGQFIADQTAGAARLQAERAKHFSTHASSRELNHDADRASTVKKGVPFVGMTKDEARQAFPLGPQRSKKEVSEDGTEYDVWVYDYTYPRTKAHFYMVLKFQDGKVFGITR